MPDPKPDRSAMGLLKRVRHECWKFAIGSTAMALGDWIEKELPTTERHARNVDKQRRRLLADRVSVRVEQLDFRVDQANRYDTRTAKHDVLERNSSKLRTIAARLRGTK